MEVIDKNIFCYSQCSFKCTVEILKEKVRQIVYQLFCVTHMVN